jgi:hypothetical protein
MLQYWVSPSELTFSLAWHFGHIFSLFVNKPPWISIFKTARFRWSKARKTEKIPWKYTKDLKGYSSAQGNN